MPQESGQDSEFETLSALLQRSCPGCGANNPLRATECKECGGVISQKESDKESLSFLHAEGIDSDPASHTNSHKLKRLTLALEGVKVGEFGVDVYHAVVEQVLREAQAVQEVLRMQALQQVESKLSTHAVDILRDTVDHVDAFCQACVRMLEYDGTNDLGVAEAGLDMAEGAVEDMEETQAEAAELRKK